MNPKYFTTLNKIRSCDPCREGWSKLLASLGKTSPDDEPLHLLHILESNGLDDCLWALRAVDNIDREARLLAVRFAREVQHLMADSRSVAALDVAERFARGEADPEELKAAEEAALATRRADWAAWEAAALAARGATREATREAAREAAWVAWAAWEAAHEAAWQAAWQAARAAALAARGAARKATLSRQEQILREELARV